MAEKIDEEVSVGFLYDSKEKIARPWVVKWRGRTYKIDKIGLHHQFWEGKTLMHFFSVCAQETFLRLSFNTVSLHWRLEEIATNIGI